MSEKRVKYLHPSMPKLPMTGHVEFSEWEGVDKLFKWYGYDADAGLETADATVTPL
jgi:hypothetical protein